MLDETFTVYYKLFRIDRCLVYTGKINKDFLHWYFIYSLIYTGIMVYSGINSYTGRLSINYYKNTGALQSDHHFSYNMPSVNSNT